MKSLLPKFIRSTKLSSSEAYHRELLRREASIGGELFGPVQSGHQRDFFCLDEYTWIWHETWKDEKNREQSLTVRYEVRPDSILKIQSGKPYQIVQGQEAQNLIDAIRFYSKRVVMELYLPSSYQTQTA